MVASPLPTAEAKRIGSGGAIRTPPLSSCLIHRSAWKGYSPKFGPQGDLEVSGLVLRQPFFDRQYDPFRQHELRWRCNQPRDQVCHPLWREYSGRRSLVRSTLLALLGREGSPVGVHRSRVEHNRSYAMLLPFVGEGFGEACKTELGSAVSRGVGPTLLSRHRGDVDDNAASRLAHMREGRLRQQKGRPEVHSERAIPSLYGELLDHAGRVCASSVDQYVYAPEGLDGPSDRLRRLGLADEVHGKD